MFGDNRLKPLVALVGGRQEKHEEGKYYLFWYEDPKRRYKPLGQGPSLALLELEKQERKLEYLAAGGEVKEDDPKRLKIRDTVEQWVEDQSGEWELHRFRKTFVCVHHERNHVSVNMLREWPVHESLDMTLAYLKGSDAASEPVQELVANVAPAAYV